MRCRRLETIQIGDRRRVIVGRFGHDDRIAGLLHFRSQRDQSLFLSYSFVRMITHYRVRIVYLFGFGEQFQETVLIVHGSDTLQRPGDNRVSGARERISLNAELS